jgi:hypothetical protein
MKYGYHFEIPDAVAERLFDSRDLHDLFPREPEEDYVEYLNRLRREQKIVHQANHEKYVQYRTIKWAEEEVVLRKEELKWWQDHAAHPTFTSPDIQAMEEDIITQLELLLDNSLERFRNAVGGA